MRKTKTGYAQKNRICSEVSCSEKVHFSVECVSFGSLTITEGVSVF